LIPDALLDPVAIPIGGVIETIILPIVGVFVDPIFLGRFLVLPVSGIICQFFPLPFPLSGLLAFLFMTVFMLFDFPADLKKTTTVPAPAHRFFHMHLLTAGDTLFYGTGGIVICQKPRQ